MRSEENVAMGCDRDYTTDKQLSAERDRLARIERDRELGYELHRWADRLNVAFIDDRSGHMEMSTQKVAEARALADWIIRQTTVAAERLRCR